jgi:ubiquinone/menaquinone biosynthesis C-methylase UbiE
MLPHSLQFCSEQTVGAGISGTTGQRKRACSNEKRYRLGFYQDRIVPHLINLAMRNRQLVPYRQRVISAAQGRVLEIGIGSCANIPFYGSSSRQLIGLEPAPRLLAMAQRASTSSALPVTLIEGSSEAIPLDSASVDTVVSTWTLCSIPDAVGALREMRRVLKPSGRLLFAEHGLASEPNMQKWQNWLTPAWKRLGGGCHLNRAISELIGQAGFRIERLETGYLAGRNPMTFMYEGAARP